jgi:NADPH-dependent 2,4-dienoyl-CoA reductase/sulfur reductase-like enzyme
VNRPNFVGDRAFFCGIGVCQACVTPDGQRPCLEPVAGESLGADPELVVVGAGPAGLSAALAAADAGVRVAVIDRGKHPGGQYLRQGQVDARSPELVRRSMAHQRVRFLLGHEVWRVRPDRTLDLAGVDGRGVLSLQPAAVVLAPGAYDKVIPFPGWELPGVVTVGGAQALLKGQGRTVGDRVLVAGTGPLLLSLAVSLAKAGVNVVGVADPVPVTRWLPHLSTVVGAPRKVAQAIAYRTRLATLGVRIWSERLESVTREGERLTVRLASRTLTVDAVAVGHGFTPQTELAEAIGCTLRIDPRDGSTIVDSCPEGVFAAGELTGVAGADAAVATGTLAGLAAAHRLGKLDGRAYVRASRRWLKRAAAAARFATALHAVHSLETEFADDTVLCRCEGVTFGTARAAAALGADDPRALKLLTRVGMGPCQGRMCGASAAALLGCPPLAYSHRPVAVPVPLTAFLARSRRSEGAPE